MVGGKDEVSRELRSFQEGRKQTGVVIMTNCKGCRALEFISGGARRGAIMDYKLTVDRYNCALGNKIIVLNEKPCCENCSDKTTRRKI